MADECFVCEKSLPNSATVTAECGMQSLREASVKRGEEHIQDLNSMKSMIVHVECRKQYTSNNSIEAYKKHRLEGSPSTSQYSPHRKRSATSSFDFRNLCLFFAEPASEEKERKKKKKYRSVIRNITTVSFKDTILRAARGTWRPIWTNSN